MLLNLHSSIRPPANTILLIPLRRPLLPTIRRPRKVFLTPPTSTPRRDNLTTIYRSRSTLMDTSYRHRGVLYMRANLSTRRLPNQSLLCKTAMAI